MILFLLSLMACHVKEDDSKLKDVLVEIPSQDLEGYSPLPIDFFLPGEEANIELISLGKKLFNEKSLSASNEISCSSCHDLTKAGTDLQQFSKGHNKSLTGRNSPTVLNAAGHAFQFWDGRVMTVEDQALGPILAAGEMAMPNEESVVALLKSRPEYIDVFKKAFPDQMDPITFKNVGIAIGSYERTLSTPSRWDMFLDGDKNALSDDEKKGFITFNKTGCGTCHSGSLLGGHMFMKVGVVHPWPNQSDLGRFEVTKNETDKMVFKVPSLRNVAVTGPYFHDGSVANLNAAVKMMAYYQLGKDLTDEEVGLIEAWLGSTSGVLTGE